jgi:L-Ala-D/L-Glu epimerase
MMRCEIALEKWAMIEPFEIAREIITDQPVLMLKLSDGLGHTGFSEAAGVDYDGETPQSLAVQIESVAAQLHDSLTGIDLLSMLPPGGARNAIDCALWDLRAKQTETPAWKTAGLVALKAVSTAYTIGLGDEAATRRKARAARRFPLLKLKVDADRHLDVIRIVRQEHPSARIVLDANQAWSLALLKKILPQLMQFGVELIEQPLHTDSDAELDHLNSPIPLAADESCTDRSSLPQLVGRYQFVNIKLDKCGGLTEALLLAAQAKQQGLKLMVGNMCGTSLAMAPAFLLAQQCQYVDLDGPLLQQLDRPVPLDYNNDVIQPPKTVLWG